MDIGLLTRICILLMKGMKISHVLSLLGLEVIETTILLV
jgi:hypothetical protein